VHFFLCLTPLPQGAPHSQMTLVTICLPYPVTGCIISISQGEVSRYALTELQPRGVFFVQPGDQVGHQTSITRAEVCNLLGC
jgi:predicted membrane GTPase involved in stress response